MKNKKWMVGDARWNPRVRQRVEEQFRRHVRTPRKNPRGRIERQPCPFCIRDAMGPPGFNVGHSLESAIALTGHFSTSQFHHLDYKNPFLGVWCCNSHHRMIEHGSVAVYKRDVWDYSSVVAPLLRPKAATAALRRHARRSSG